jgi:hypothetical protein
MVKYVGFANSPWPFFCMLSINGEKRCSPRLISVSSGAVVVVLFTYRPRYLPLDNRSDALVNKRMLSLEIMFPNFS